MKCMFEYNNQLFSVYVLTIFITIQGLSCICYMYENIQVCVNRL